MIEYSYRTNVVCLTDDADPSRTLTLSLDLSSAEIDAAIADFDAEPTDEPGRRAAVLARLAELGIDVEDLADVLKD